MSLIGDLEFRTIINNRPIIIKAQNTQLLGIEVLSENGVREGTFTIDGDSGKTTFTIEALEEEH
jgi:hypothetical protein